MKTHIIRLDSVVPHGVGGPEAGSMDFIYSILLQKHGQHLYKQIWVNQIGDDLDEVIIKQPGKEIAINIRYPVFEDFEKKSTDEQNRIRLDVAHNALLRIAKEDKKLDVVILEEIRDEIVKNNFNFEFVYKSAICNNNPQLIANVVVVPKVDGFLFYITILDNNIEKCRELIYTGSTSSYYFDALFSKIKWHKDQLVSVMGQDKGMEIRLTVNRCYVEYVNHTNYKNAPFFYNDEKRE